MRFRDLSRIASARDLVEPNDGLHLRFIPQTALQQASVTEHERGDGTDPLRAAVIFRDEVESLRERSLQIFFLEHGAYAPDRIGDLVGDQLAGLTESRGSHDVRVNSLLGFYQVEFALDMLAFGLMNRAAARISWSVRFDLFIDLNEAGGRFGEAPSWAWSARRTRPTVL